MEFLIAIICKTDRYCSMPIVRCGMEVELNERGD